MFVMFMTHLGNPGPFAIPFYSFVPACHRTIQSNNSCIPSLFRHPYLQVLSLVLTIVINININSQNRPKKQYIAYRHFSKMTENQEAVNIYVF